MMKLIDALRLADLEGVPDLRTRYFAYEKREWQGEKCPACAIGGANIAARNAELYIEPGSNETSLRGTINTLDKLDCQGLDEKIFRCPYCNPDVAHAFLQSEDLKALIIHMYDDHFVSRTEIADFLETQLVKQEE